MFAPGRKLPARPAKPGDTNSARRAAALQTSQMGQFEEQGFFLLLCHLPLLFQIRTYQTVDQRAVGLVLHLGHQGFHQLALVLGGGFSQAQFGQRPLDHLADGRFVKRA